MDWCSWRLGRLAWGPVGRRGQAIRDYLGYWRPWVWRLWWLTPLRW
jgi:hypothetical protein